MTPSDETASERGRRVIDVLRAQGARLGFDVACEYPVQGGRLDVVWLLPQGSAIPGVEAPLPAVGFEVESSWRTRKHLKGDYLNLADLGAALGVIVLLGDGDDVDATRRFAEILVARPGPRILVWSEADIQRLAGQHAPDGLASVAVGPANSRAQLGNDASPQHAGKYRALWAWLRSQDRDRVPMTFREIEEIIGIPLPPSCRKHSAHWSGYEGSAVARAIHDAGWSAKDVDIKGEQLVFVQDG